MRTVCFDVLLQSDLIVDAVYEGSADGQLAGEPIAKLLPGSGNMGGFRICGQGERKNWVVLFSTGEDRDWPDTLDLSTGQFVYYGDNKTPGHELHDTSAGGNRVLRYIFAQLHSDQEARAGIEPFFIFKKYPTANGSRSVQFKGVAVPGYPALMTDQRVIIDEITRATKEVSRLISRIRHRQFGVLVTTSVIARQAYEEVREDRHPIIFICGRDIAEILIRNGYNTPERVGELLQREFEV